MYLAFLHQLIKKLLTDYQKIRTFSISVPSKSNMFRDILSIVQNYTTYSSKIIANQLVFVSLDIPQKRKLRI